MKMKKSTTIARLLGALAVTIAGASSADVTWTFNTANCESTSGPTGKCSSGALSMYRTYSGTGVGAQDATVSGWANTANLDTGGNNNALALGQITHYSGGLGVKNADANNGDLGEGVEPEHAVDNDQRYDLVLFDFGAGNSVALTDIQIGWVSGDADINLLAYQGGGAGDTPVLTGVEFSSSAQGLTGNGWVHVGDYDLSPNQAAPSVNLDPDGVGPITPYASRYWIVAAHNNVFGTNCAYDGNGCPSNKDYFKIKSVSGHYIPDEPAPGVPVPGTLALLAIGALAVRRKLAAA